MALSLRTILLSFVEALSYLDNGRKSMTARNPTESNRKSKFENPKINDLRLEIFTPEAKAYSGRRGHGSTLPGSERRTRIYPQHVPVLTTLRRGTADPEEWPGDDNGCG